MKREIKYSLAALVISTITLILSAAAAISVEWIVSPTGITRYSGCFNESSCLLPPSDLLRTSEAFRILSWLGQALSVLLFICTRFSKTQLRIILIAFLTSVLASGVCLLVAQTDYSVKIRSHFAGEDFHFGHSFNIAWAATIFGVLGGFWAVWVLVVIVRKRFGLPERGNKDRSGVIQTVSSAAPGSPLEGHFGFLTPKKATIKHSRFRIPSESQTEGQQSLNTSPKQASKEPHQISEIVITKTQEHGLLTSYKPKSVDSTPTSPVARRRSKSDATPVIRGILKPQQSETSTSNEPLDDTNVGDSRSYSPGDFSRLNSQQDLKSMSGELKTKQPEKPPRTPAGDNNFHINIEPLAQRRRYSQESKQSSSRKGGSVKKGQDNGKNQKPHTLRVLAMPRQVGRHRTRHAKHHTTTKKYATVTMTDKGMKVKTVEVKQSA